MEAEPVSPGQNVWEADPGLVGFLRERLGFGGGEGGFGASGNHRPFLLGQGGKKVQDEGVQVRA
jgi:hypothetical protein